MKFVLAPDSFKESMTAKEVCIAMENGIRRVYKEAECIHMPMADGGEGSIDFQSKFGKTPVGVSMIAKKYGIPVIVFAGNVGEGIEELYDLGVTSVVGILPGVVTIDEALEE